MPRSKRIPSPSGIYHVMLRGINHENIFHDELDFMKMEKILRSLAKPVDGNGNPKPPLCKIYAYCLMTNHVHLLLAELQEPIGSVVKRLGVAYVSYYNKRRSRTGPLFEGRFRSEPVDHYEYFVNLLHYIHYNPVNAGMVSKPGWYKWSSWHEYELPDETLSKGICEQTIPFKNLDREQVKEVVLTANAPKDFTSLIDKKRVDLNEAVAIIKSLVPKEYSNKELMDLPKVEKVVISSKALDYGLTYSQIISILGLNKSAIYRGRLKRAKFVK